LIYRVVTVLGASAVRSLSVPGTGKQRWIRRLPFFAAAWTQHRDLPAPADKSFQARWRQQQTWRMP
jgi:L-lactate dehydrogenase complex protein LldF